MIGPESGSDEEEHREGHLISLEHDDKEISSFKQVMKRIQNHVQYIEVEMASFLARKLLVLSVARIAVTVTKGQKCVIFVNEDRYNEVVDYYQFCSNSGNWSRL